MTKFDVQLGDTESQVFAHLKALSIDSTTIWEESGSGSDGKSYRILQFSLKESKLGNVSMLFCNQQLVYINIGYAYYAFNAINEIAIVGREGVNIVSDSDDLFYCFCGYNYLAFEGDYAVLFNRESQLNGTSYHFFYLRPINFGRDREDVYDTLLNQIRCIRNEKASDIFTVLTSCGG